MSCLWLLKLRVGSREIGIREIGIRDIGIREVGSRDRAPGSCRERGDGEKGAGHGGC